LNVGDEIRLKDGAYENQIFLRAKQAPRLELPDYLRKDEKEGKDIGSVLAVPGTEHVPFTFDAGLFTEYYAARSV
jgi:small subunit ribosomal protein S4